MINSAKRQESTQDRKGAGNGTWPKPKPPLTPKPLEVDRMESTPFKRTHKAPTGSHEEAKHKESRKPPSTAESRRLERKSEASPKVGASTGDSGATSSTSAAGVSTEKLTKEDRNQIMASAAMGMVAGLSYGLWQWFVTKQYPVENLTPKPQAFFMDKHAGDLYARMAPYITTQDSKTFYTISLQRCDSLFQLEFALLEYLPNAKDLYEAQEYARDCCLYARKFKHEVGSKRENAEVEMEELVELLELMVGEHLTKITQLCSR